MAITAPPATFELIGDCLALRWPDGREDFLPAELLRRHSPSAENQGEVDILGVRHGGDNTSAFPGIRILKLNRIGNYALQIVFSDGHRTGLFSWAYLRTLGEVDSGGTGSEV